MRVIRLRADTFMSPPAELGLGAGFTSICPPALAPAAGVRAEKCGFWITRGMCKTPLKPGAPAAVGARDPDGELFGAAILTASQ